MLPWFPQNAAASIYGFQMKVTLGGLGVLAFPFPPADIPSFESVETIHCQLSSCFSIALRVYVVLLQSRVFRKKNTA